MSRSFVIPLFPIVFLLLCSGRADAQDALAFADDTDRSAALRVQMEYPSKEPQQGVSFVTDARFDVPNRLRVVRDLGQNLSETEVQQLMSFLKATPSQLEQNIEGLRALKNEILNVLREQEQSPHDLTETLISIYENQQQDEVLRDYAVQHMGTWYQQLHAREQTEKVLILRTLKKAVEEEGMSTAGTALLALHRLVPEGDLSDLWISQRAVKIAKATEAHFAARTSAIQICSERNLTEVLPVVEQLAVSSRLTPIRLSAIAALERLGGHSKASILQQLLNDGDGLVRAHVRAVLDVANEDPNTF